LIFRIALAVFLLLAAGAMLLTVMGVDLGLMPS
jgi:hypothetical protein